jgi:hypothetical protein
MGELVTANTGSACASHSLRNLRRIASAFRADVRRRRGQVEQGEDFLALPQAEKDEVLFAYDQDRCVRVEHRGRRVRDDQVRAVLNSRPVDCVPSLMSDPCLIGRENGDGTVTAIRCNWSGYTKRTGAILRDNYATHEKIDALMALGELGRIAENIGEKHRYGHGPEDWCDAYGRDREEDDAEAAKTYSANDYLNSYASDYAWVYLHSITDGAWTVRVRHLGREFLYIDAAIQAEATPK